ncbi:hypothetical protein ACQYWQ_11145 [Streptomyces sp. P6-2-1]|uniref:hypothetical protein n=1 Tax=Streptomyces sp. P6-2-1 TaxID=3422591 RepID=UPI003D367FF5
MTQPQPPSGRPGQDPNTAQNAAPGRQDAPPAPEGFGPPAGFGPPPAPAGQFGTPGTPGAPGTPSAPGAPAAPAGPFGAGHFGAPAPADSPSSLASPSSPASLGSLGSATPEGTGRLVAGIVAALVVALVTAGIYGWLIGAMEREVGYAAIGVGLLVGLATGRIGGRSPVLPVVAALFSLGAVYAGQLVGEAAMGAKQLPVSTRTLLTDHLGLVQDAWKADADFLTVVFFLIAAAAAFSATRKGAARG